MDETGFLPSLRAIHKVFRPQSDKVFCETINGMQELISVISTICGDGTTLTLMTIYKGKDFLSSWGVADPACNPIGSRYGNGSYMSTLLCSLCNSIAVSPKGYTNSEICLVWFQAI